jgi:N-acetylneuraminic acid mutarotase
MMLRRLRILVWAGLITQFIGPTPPLQADVSSDLVAHYPFDGNATDVSGGHDGVAYGLSQTVDRCGFDKGALYFNQAGYISIPDTADLHFQQLSACVWLQPDGFTGIRIVLSKDDGGKGIQFYLNGVGGACLGFFGLGDGSWHNVQFGATLVPGRWCHLAATADGQYLRVFVDGNPAGSIPFAGTVLYGTRDFEIGRNTYSHLQYFSGAMDDLRLYDRALSLAEIQQLARERPGLPFSLAQQPLPGAVALSWPSWAGWSYTAQVATNLTGNSWAGLPDFTNVPGTGQSLACTNQLSADRQACFRVKAQGPAVVPSAWTQSAPLPTPKADFTMAAWNNKLYAFGGYNLTAADPRNETYAYDPASGVWTRQADMPTARWGPIACEFNGQIYVFCGQGTAGGVNKNEVYDPVSNTWQNKTGAPSGLAAQGLMGVRYGNRFHLFYAAAHYEYDPAADSYTAKTGMPTARTWGTCAVVNNRIYVIGGYAYPGGTTNVNEVYDPATDTWSTKAPLPVPKYGVTRENPVINGFIYVTHGRDANFYTSNYLYDPATDAWRQKASAQHPRDGVGCCAFNGLLYVVGGRADFPGPYGLIDHEIYDPSADY